MEGKSKVITSLESLASDTVLRFRRIELTNDKVSIKTLSLLSIIFLLISILIYIYSDKYHLYILFSFSSAFILYNWKYVSFFIYNRLREEVKYFVPYYQNNITSEEYEYFSKADTLLNLQESIKRERYKNNEIVKSYYLGIRDTDSKYIKVDELINLIKIKDIFNSANHVDMFFLVSFFTINIIYSILILGLIMWIKKASIINIALNSLLDNDTYKALFVLLVLFLFGLTISIFLKYLLPIDENSKRLILNESYRKRLENIEIFETEKQNIFKFNIDNLKSTIDEVEKKLNEKKANIFQIATPIFFLGYISLVISFFQMTYKG